MSNFRPYDSLTGEVKERALRAGLGHVCSSFDETISPLKIIEEMREAGFSSGAGELFEPCEQYELTPWDEVADTVEIIARDMYEFARSIYSDMPKCVLSGVYLHQDMCTKGDFLQFDEMLTDKQCDDIGGSIFTELDAEAIRDRVACEVE